MATRRLPVIQEPTGEDAAAASRPPWQWVLVGSGLLVTIWTPSVATSLVVARKISASAAVGAATAAGLVATTLALASLATGYLVARFGPKTRVRHAALAGLVAAGELWVLALLGGAFTSALVGASALLSLAALAAPFASLGAWLRKKSPS